MWPISHIVQPKLLYGCKSELTHWGDCVSHKNCPLAFEVMKWGTAEDEDWTLHVVGSKLAAHRSPHFRFNNLCAFSHIACSTPWCRVVIPLSEGEMVLWHIPLAGLGRLELSVWGLLWGLDGSLLGLWIEMLIWQLLPGRSDRFLELEPCPSGDAFRQQWTLIKHRINFLHWSGLFHCQVIGFIPRWAYCGRKWKSPRPDKARMTSSHFAAPKLLMLSLKSGHCDDL